jgi:fucose permease
MMIALLLVGGMGVALLGSVKVSLAARLRIDEARVGGLVSLFGFTLAPVIFTAGFLTDLNREVVLVAGSVFLAGSLGLLAVARNYLAALGAVLLFSAGWALLINVGNVLTLPAFPGSKAYATNLANVFFGLGAFLTPLAFAVLVRRTSFPVVVCALSVVALLPAILALRVDFAALAPAAPAAEEQGSFVTMLADPVLWLCGFTLFFYGPLEASVGAWATTYLGEQGYGEGKASSLLSGFWLAYLAARLVTAFMLPRGWEGPFIVILSLASVAVLSGMVLGRGRRTAASMVLAAGLVFGPIFPTLVAVLLGHFAESLHGRAVGMLFAVGGIGWAVIPLFIGAIASRRGVRRGFAVAVAAACGLSVVALALSVAGAPA